MGYYTRYELSFDHGYDPVLEEKVMKRIEEISGYTYLFDQEVKWYEHIEDMLTLSKEFPEIVFTLNGEGEESGDVWVAYFLNGKHVVHKAEIVLPKFDINDLT